MTSRAFPHNTFVAHFFRGVLIVIFLFCVATQYAAVLVPGFSAIAVCIVTALCAGAVLLTEPAQKVSRKLSHQTQRSITIAFWAIIIIAAGIRISALSPGVIYVDAFYHLLAAQHMLQGMAPEYIRSLLYTLLITATEAIGGQNVTLVMVMNMVINLSTIVVLYGIARKLFSSAIALCAIALLALSPWSIIMSHYIRMYDFFQLCALITIYLVYCFFVEGSKPKIKEKTTTYMRRLAFNAAVVALACAVTFHVHAIAASIFSLFSAMLLVCAVFQMGRYLYLRDLKGFFTDRFIIGAGCLILGATIFYTLFPSVVYQFRSNFSLHIDVSDLIANNRGYYQFFLHQFPAPLMGFFVGIAIAGACVYYKRSPQFLFFISLCIGLLAQLPFFDRYFSPRYAYHVLPLLVLAIAIGIVLFARVLTRTYLRSYPGASGNVVTVVICVLMVVLCIPYKNFSQIYVFASNGEDQIFEISYPYERALNTITIEPTDSLFSLNYGIWDIMQDVSSHIFPVILLSINGATGDKQAVAHSFFEQLTHATHGWFLSDVYRQKFWDCGVAEMNSCVVREFVDEAFVLTPEHTVDNLLLYEWKPHFFNQTALQNKPSQDIVVGGVMVHSLFWMDTLELSPGIVDGTLNVSHTVRSLKNNTQGAFVVMHPTGYRADGASVVFEKEVLFVPAYTDSARVIKYTFPYAARQPLNPSDIKKITVTLSVLDIATQQMTREYDTLTVYSHE